MLETEILGMKLSNPLFLAAGILGTTSSSMKMVARAGAGGIVTKSFSIEPNDGYDNPTIVKIEGGVINSVGLASPGVEAKKEELKDLNEIRDKTPVIASIYGDTEEVFCDVADRTKEYVEKVLKENEKYIKHFKIMEELATILKKRRMKNGFSLTLLMKAN